MSDLTKLSAAKLNALIAKRDAANSALLSEVIAAGWGSTRGNEITEMVRNGSAPPLLVEYDESRRAYCEASSELAARRRYHGGDKPIKLRLTC